MSDWTAQGATREEWMAKAEESERTSRFPSERVSDDPATWLSEAEIAEATALVQAIVKAARKTLPTEGGHRQDINRAALEFRKEAGDSVINWHCRAYQLCSSARRANIVPEQVARLDTIRQAMNDRQEVAGRQAEDVAVAEEIERRKSEAAWLEVVAWRERIDRTGGITITHVRL
jgi:hypothetical protein